MCKNNNCEKTLFSSKSMEIDLSYSMDEIICSYIGNDNGEIIRECCNCENTDFIKVCCFECEIFLCSFCIEDIEKNGYLEDDWSLIYNSYEEKYICICKVDFCGMCDTWNNNENVRYCNNCETGFCCGYIEWNGDIYCLDCMEQFKVEEFEPVDCCNSCGDNCNQLTINNIKVYSDNIKFLCECCI